MVLAYYTKQITKQKGQQVNLSEVNKGHSTQVNTKTKPHEKREDLEAYLLDMFILPKHVPPSLVGTRALSLRKWLK